MSDKATMIAQEGSVSRLATLCALYSIRDGDIAAIQSYGNIVVPKWDEFVALFYDWLKKQPAFEVFFPDDETLAHVHSMSRGDWQDFFRHDPDGEYLAKRNKIRRNPCPHRAAADNIYRGHAGCPERCVQTAGLEG